MSDQKKRSLKSLQPLRATQFDMTVSPTYAWVTILIAWAISFLPWRNWPGTPDILLLVLAFWCVHGIVRVGLVTAFIFGILMDVQDTNLLGTHAVTYTIVLFCMMLLRKRMLQFTPVGQFFHVWPIFILAPIPSYVISMWLQGNTWHQWDWLLSGPLTGILWIFVDLVLRLPFGFGRNDDATL
ncbi:rod shape-determining protein MreD [Basilea psittacipulmonis]|uniref:Uncharacterized protein n=1 Tax=Basilea psittacipulmonis DSM 24701 TaxID=1072685 RepID=A0A077DBS7_9BURK|nr:rod shape-determining protein MreD [Basilea psittacipulmonis]AIL32114.1 hypothetical protein IX83_01150 [Basilea psittacipulmonis DSM 24701]